MAYGTARPLFRIMTAATLLALSCPAFAGTGESPPPPANIAIARAREICLKAFPGTIMDHEFEQEHGGGHRYAFDIKNGPVTQEVGVDAITGKVFENQAEGPNPD